LCTNIEQCNLTYEKHTQWTMYKKKKNNGFMYEIYQQVDEWISYNNFSFPMKQLNNEKWNIVDDILY
jgi:hypothetical protein